jgi:hypothetical protein
VICQSVFRQVFHYGKAVIVVDPDHGNLSAAIRCGPEYSFLCGDIAGHIAVPVEMVWRHVQQNGYVEHCRLRQVQLVG